MLANALPRAQEDTILIGDNKRWVPVIFRILAVGQNGLERGSRGVWKLFRSTTVSSSRGQKALIGFGLRFCWCGSSRGKENLVRVPGEIKKYSEKSLEGDGFDQKERVI